MGSRIFPLSGDLMFKHIFGYQKRSYFAEHLLQSLFPVDYYKFLGLTISNSIKLDRETIMQKKFETDVQVVLKNGELINLEMYSNFDKNAELKSLMYITSRFSGHLKVQENYNNTKSNTQINFVNGKNVHHNEGLINKYILINENNPKDSIAKNFFQIFIIDVDKLDKVIYNDSMSVELYLWLKLIKAKDTEEIIEIGKKSEIMREVVEEMERFSNEGYVQDYHYDEVFKRSQMESELEESKDMGVAQGKLEIAKSLFAKGYDISTILEIANFKLEEIDILDNYSDDSEILEEIKKFLDKSSYNDVVDEKTKLDEDFGVAKEKENIAKKMITKGFDLDTISEITSLSKKEIEKLIDKNC